jgi:hypothetical protein
MRKSMEAEELSMRRMIPVEKARCRLLTGVVSAIVVSEVDASSRKPRKRIIGRRFQLTIRSKKELPDEQIGVHSWIKLTWRVKIKVNVKRVLCVKLV